MSADGSFAAVRGVDGVKPDRFVQKSRPDAPSACLAHASTRHSADGGGKLSLVRCASGASRFPSSEVAKISDTPLLEARPTHERDVAAAAGPSSLVDWARRALLQSEIASARELAGLSDAELTRLENEFSRCPTRPRPSWQRDAVPVGIAFLLLAGCAFAAPQVLARLSDLDAQYVRIAGAALILIGLLAPSARYIASLSGAPLDRAYRLLGLWVSQLHDRHPWLYETLGVARHEAADAYRRKVLEERGLLRGADYILMCEIVRVHEALDRARPASFVVEQLQLLPAPPPPVDDGGAVEPRLVPIAVGRRGQA